MKEGNSNINSLFNAFWKKVTFGQNLKLIIFVALEESMDVISIIYFFISNGSNQETTGTLLSQQ